MDRKPFRILAVAGSLRQGSYNRGLLRAAQEVAPAWVEVRFFDIGQLPFFNEDISQCPAQQTGGPLVSARSARRAHQCAAGDWSVEMIQWKA